MRDPSKTRRLILGIGLVVAVTLAVVKAYFIGYYRIPQNGMYPGLPAGSRLLTAKRAYAEPSAVKRGDIIVFERNEEGKAYTYIWRVVALPGDKVEATGEKLSINGQAVLQQKVRETGGRMIFREQLDDKSYEVAFDHARLEPPSDVSLTVPQDHFFVMGDNRFEALDSRSFGPIPFRSIRGRKL
jgi:signal peptidase I